MRGLCNAPIAQLDRAPGYELGGREFESLWAHHIKQRVNRKRLALLSFWDLLGEQLREQLDFFGFDPHLQRKLLCVINLVITVPDGKA